MGTEDRPGIASPLSLMKQGDFSPSFPVSLLHLATYSALARVRTPPSADAAHETSTTISSFLSPVFCWLSEVNGFSITHHFKAESELVQLGTAWWGRREEGAGFPLPREWRETNLA